MKPQPSDHYQPDNASGLQQNHSLALASPAILLDTASAGLGGCLCWTVVGWVACCYILSVEEEEGALPPVEMPKLVMELSPWEHWVNELLKVEYQRFLEEDLQLQGLELYQLVGLD